MKEHWHPIPLPPLTRTQRRIKRAIEAGGIVIWCTSVEDDDGYDPDAHYLLLHADPSDPIGIGYTERVQQRSLLPLVWRGLLDDDWCTPTREEVALWPPWPGATT